MELPIYQENLRSSGDWRSGLKQVRIVWLQNKMKPEVIDQLRESQLQVLDKEVDAENFLVAAKSVSTWAPEPNSQLTVPRLLEINRTLTENETLFRENEATPLTAFHEPPIALIVPRMLDNAIGWFATEGFSEMNPVEQAALVYLRILDLQPFASLNSTMANLAANFYTERAGLPPLIFDATEARFQAALDSAFKMLTQHLVDYFAAALTKTVKRFEI